jgi:hypothetical protein
VGWLIGRFTHVIHVDVVVRPAHRPPSVEGVGGLYRGLVPNIMRNSLMNMAELVTYDVTKQTLLSLGIADGLPVHALSGAAADAGLLVQ